MLLEKIVSSANLNILKTKLNKNMNDLKIELCVYLSISTPSSKFEDEGQQCQGRKG